MRGQDGGEGERVRGREGERGGNLVDRWGKFVYEGEWLHVMGVQVGQRIYRNFSSKIQGSREWDGMYCDSGSSGLEMFLPYFHGYTN